jgi:hypothetical protein
MWTSAVSGELRSRPERGPELQFGGGRDYGVNDNLAASYQTKFRASGQTFSHSA